MVLESSSFCELLIESVQLHAPSMKCLWSHVNNFDFSLNNQPLFELRKGKCIALVILLLHDIEHPIASIPCVAPNEKQDCHLFELTSLIQLQMESQDSLVFVLPTAIAG
jgi:hypothetical protein